MRPNGIGLKHHGKVPTECRNGYTFCRVVDDRFANDDAPFRRAFQPSQTAKRRGFAAATGPQKRIELALFDIDRDTTHSVNLTFVALSKELGLIEGQVAALFVMVIAAAEVTVGLAIIVAIFRRRSSANVDELAELRG
jgi:hypothetical protein